MRNSKGVRRGLTLKKQAGAVFLDRDGVINALVYNSDADISESPRTTEEFRLISGVGTAIRKLNKLGMKVVVVSNQPDVGKGRISERRFNRIREHMHRLLSRSAARIDAEYYCFHHPKASIRAYRRICPCRKPKPGLLLLAAKDMGISLRKSYMIGDRPADILAGKKAGCMTIWLNDMKCEYCTIMHGLRIQPDLIFRRLPEAASYIIDSAKRPR